jgi:hypothetical protein
MNPNPTPHPRSRSGRALRPGAGLLPAAALLLGGVLVGCGGADDAADAPIPPSGDERIVQLAVSPETAPAVTEAALRIVTPSDGDRFQEGEDVEVRLGLVGYELRVPTPTGDERGLARAPDGQHIHLIVNDRSYQAIYDLDEPVVLEDLPAGTHVIRAFPGRDWHESVKSPGVFDQVVIVVGDGDLDAFVGPNVVYSRPQGVYEGAQADSILVDFYVDGIELGEDSYQLLFTLNDTQTFRITTWQPYLLVDVPAGEHTLRMELFDAAGQRVETPFIPMERSFEVRR